MTLLSTIYNSLQEGENLQITVQKAKGKAAVFVIPSLGEENKAECEQARALRSALATPLAFRGEIADIEEALEHGLQDYLSLQSSGRKTYDTLARLRTAVNKGKEGGNEKKHKFKIRQLQPRRN